MLPNKTLWVSLLAMGAAGLLALVWWLTDHPDKSASAQPTGGAARTPRHAASGATDPLASAVERLREKPDRAATLQTLKDLQAALKSMPRDEALAWIRAFLESGQDQPTGLPFEIAAGGNLTTWPTFRTFLLDALSAIDPAAAAALGRQILTTPTTADEWALALRNVGRVETTAEAAALLIEKTAALIANPAWQANPSVGYLNAFDVLVHTNATASTPLLSGLIQQKDRKDLAHAGFLTLDRLVQRNPAEVLPQLAADTALQQSRPEMTAQQFARADLRDETQRGIVKSWLLDPARTATELRSFAAVYPNNNRFISNNLLTSESQQSGPDLAAHDREVLAIIKAWTEDPAFEPVKEHLATMTARLTGFVGSPTPPGPPKIKNQIPD
ncbi:MAG: hypothetical protein NTV46_11580, partial [Verrucomicrobia bacterium]|nr:hypothetical protein [Verrucomicrobiota bacterium]